MTTKECPNCGRVHPATLEYFAPGGVREFDSYCRPCRVGLTRYRRAYMTPEQRKRKQEREREWAKRNPERAKAGNRRRNAAYMERLNADPERRAEYLERKRMEYRLRKERQGGELAAKWNLSTVKGAYDPKNDPRVDAAPLRAFVQVFHDHTMSRSRFVGIMTTTTYVETAAALGVDDTFIRRLLSGEYRGVRLATADQIFVAAGHPEMLAILYPGESKAVAA